MPSLMLVLQNAAPRLLTGILQYILVISSSLLASHLLFYPLSYLMISKWVIYWQGMSIIAMDTSETLIHVQNYTNSNTQNPLRLLVNSVFNMASLKSCPTVVLINYVWDTSHEIIVLL